MSKAPISRDKQIQLVKAAKERHSALVQRLVSDRTVRDALAKPVEQQKSYSRNDSKHLRFG